ncbi:MAG: extensin family protein [Polyangiaceae bacterium]|nr:extensin family protein [Polyangiaceae bacterium]
MLKTWPKMHSSYPWAVLRFDLEPRTAFQPSSSESASVRSSTLRTESFRRIRYLLCLTALFAGLIISPSRSAQASNKYLEIPPEAEAKNTKAYYYANLKNDEVVAELKRRKIPYRTVDPVPGVRFPIRLTGRLHGVWIHSVLPAKQRKTTPFEILDGRLALALDDFSELLAAHGFVELVHFTMYRPPHGGPAKKGHYHHRHPGGMAIDLGALKKRTGQWIAVGPHWPSQIGAKTCGDGGRQLLGRRGRELLSLACEASDLRIFHYTLTPHFDDAHADHLHMEIKTGVKWFLVN